MSLQSIEVVADQAMSEIQNCRPHQTESLVYTRRHLLKGSTVKEIFVGSSKEGLEQALQVVAVLPEAKDVKPLLWTEYFKLSES